MQVELADSSVDGLRQEPVGEDTKGNLYYYFSFNNEDCRLYRQEPPFKKSAKRRRSGGEDAQGKQFAQLLKRWLTLLSH